MSTASAAQNLVADVLGSAPVIDGHNDWVTALRRKAGYSVAGLDAVRPELHTDIPRLRQGGVGGQFCSVWAPPNLPEPETVVGVLEQIDAVYRLVETYPDDLQIAYTERDVRAAFDQGRIACLIGVEGGHMLAGSLGVLRSLARLGIRYVTLTHRDNTAWADSATDTPQVGGLNDTGRAIVAELNRLGVLVDLSHTAPTTQKDAIAASTAPVIFSHSATCALNDHPRNVSDEVLSLLPGNGGVIMVTFLPWCISEAEVEWVSRGMEEQKRLGIFDALSDLPGHGLAGAMTAGQPDVDLTDYNEWLSRNPRPTVTIAQVADHVEHARDVAGIAHIGLGSDYDGTDIQPIGLEDVSGFPRLLDELAERGWSTDDLAALTSGNILRVLRTAEELADEPLWPSTTSRSTR